MFVVYCNETGESQEDWRFGTEQEAADAADNLYTFSSWGYTYSIREEA